MIDSQEIENSPENTDSITLCAKYVDPSDRILPLENILPSAKQSIAITRDISRNGDTDVLIEPQSIQLTTSETDLPDNIDRKFKDINKVFWQILICILIANTFLLTLIGMSYYSQNRFFVYF